MGRRVSVRCPECGYLNHLQRMVESNEVMRFLFCARCETSLRVDLVDPAKVISDQRP
jgi:transcription elongation factor Elf1